MKLPIKPAPKLTSLPPNWPSKGSKVIERDDVTIITHPDRAPHKYDPATKKWSHL